MLTVVCRVQARFLQDGQALCGALSRALLWQRAGRSPSLPYSAQLYKASAAHTGRLGGLCAGTTSEQRNRVRAKDHFDCVQTVHPSSRFIPPFQPFCPSLLAIHTLCPSLLSSPTASQVKVQRVFLGNLLFIHIHTHTTTLQLYYQTEPMLSVAVEYQAYSHTHTFQS